MGLDLRSISLRLRLISLVATGMTVSLVVGGTAAGITASRSVQNEMRSALGVARQAVLNTISPARGSDGWAELISVMRAFDGNRHVRLHLEGQSGASASPALETPAIGTVPAWFARLIEVEPIILRVSLVAGDAREETVVIETDPHNELVETWDAFCDTAFILAFFSGITFSLIYVFIGRVLRPLERLGEALGEVGRGDYTPRRAKGLAPEIARLYDRFNEMAARLAAADERNRRLNEKLLTAQETERLNIARDLHDEIGPFLFAAQVDAAAIAELARARRVDEICGAVQGITEAVSHVQAQVRSMIGRLRPAGLVEFGLAETLRGLADFWRQRYPETDFRLELPRQDPGFGELVDVTIYRLAQEGLSNAVRHGNPSRVAVRIAANREERVVTIEIVDNGQGRGEKGGGFGLVGMAERVQALAGSFSSGPLSGGGFFVRAMLPTKGPATSAPEALAA
jgi:two-component system sensor histidine kinase UhpB